MPQPAADQGDRILDGADQKTPDDQRVQRPQRKPAGHLRWLGVWINRVTQKHDQALAQINEHKSRIFVGHEQKLALAGIELG